MMVRFQTFAFNCNTLRHYAPEFTTMLNRLLARDAQSRKRRLYLRTFAVIPLTEDCGYGLGPYTPFIHHLNFKPLRLSHNPQKVSHFTT